MEYFKNTLPNALSLPGMPVSAEVPNFLQSLKPDPEISIYTSSGYAPAYTALPAPLLRNVKQEDVLCDTAMQPVLPSVPMLPRDPMLPSEAMPPPQPLLPSDPMPEVFVRTAYGYVPCALPVPNLSMSVKPEDVLPGSMPSGFPELGLPTDPKTPEQQMQARRRWKRKVILAEKRKFRKMMDDMSFRKPVAMKRRQPSKKKDGPAKKTASGVKKRRKPKKKKVVVKLVPEEELIASPTTKKTPAEPPCEPVETKPDVHSKNASGDANCNKRGSSSLDSNLHLASYPVKLHLSLKRKQSRHPGTPAKKTKTAIPRVRTATNSTLNTESAPDKGLTAKAPSKKTALLKMSGNKGSSTIRDSGNKETPKPTKKPKAKAKSKSSKKPIETLPASHVPANAEDEVAVSAGASNASKEKAVTENPINPSSSGHPSSAILGAVAAVSTATPVEKSAAKSGKKTGTKKAPVRKAPAKKAKSGSKTAPKPKPNTGEEVHASAGPSKASKEKVATETPIIPNSSGNPSSAVPEHIASNSTVAPIEKLPAKTATKKATARKPPAKTGKSGSATTPKPKRSAKTQTGKVSKAKATSKKAASQVLPSKNAKSVNPAKSAPKKPKSNPKTQKKACSSDAAAGNSASTKPNGFSSSAKESAVNAPPQEATVSKAFVRDAKGAFAKSKSNVDVNKELDRVLDANFDSLASGGKTSLAKPLNANAFVVETGTKKTDEEGNANVEADSSARAIGTIDSSATTKKHPVEAWHGNPSEVFASAKEAPAATKKDISSPTGADKEKICELEREVAALKWALVRSNARDEVNPEVTQVTFKSADMGEKFANQSIETAKIAQGWSKAAGTFPPWEIRANISSSAQTRSQLSLQSVYLHVEDCIRSGSAPPCILSLRELRNGILSILKTSSKADFANTPLHATVAFAMSKMTQSFLNGVFSALLMSPSKVDMSWSTTVVTHIIEPILRFSASESRAIFADVSKSCTTAICDSANSLSTEPQLLPHVQVEKSVRAIELATAIVSTKEKSILSQVPEHNVNTIGARNVLFLIRFASVN